MAVTAKTEMEMAQKNCLVCHLQQDETSTRCEQCGWDFPIYLGSREDAQKLADEQLKQARGVWQDTLEKRQLRENVQELQGKLAAAEKNCEQLQSQMGNLKKEVTGLDQKLKQATQNNQDLQQKLSESEHARKNSDQSRNQLQTQVATLQSERTQHENRIAQLERDLRESKQTLRKVAPYTKLGHGGVELAYDATQTQGWLMTLDKRTGLIWEMKTSANKDEKYNWNDAQRVFVNKLNSQRFGGFSDWRLPTKDELESIIDKNRPDPAISTEYFPNTASSAYWAAIKGAGNTVSAWRVYFYGGYVNDYGKSNSYYARAVRAGQ